MAESAPSSFDETLGPGNLAQPQTIAQLLASLSSQPLTGTGLLAGQPLDAQMANVDPSQLTQQMQQGGLTYLGNPQSFSDLGQSMTDQSAAGRAGAISYAEAIPMMERLMKGESFFGGLTKGLPLVAALLSGPLGPLLGGALGVSGGVGSALISGGAGALAGGSRGGLEGALLGGLGGGLGALGGSGLASLLGGGAGAGAGAAAGLGDLGSTVGDFAGGVGGGALGAGAGALDALGSGLSALSGGVGDALGGLGAGAGGGGGGIASQYGDFAGPTGTVQPGSPADWANFAARSGTPGGFSGLSVGAPTPFDPTTVSPLTVTANPTGGPMINPADILTSVPFANTPADIHAPQSGSPDQGRPDFKKVIEDIIKQFGGPGGAPGSVLGGFPGGVVGSHPAPPNPVSGPAEGPGGGGPGGGGPVPIGAPPSGSPPSGGFPTFSGSGGPMGGSSAPGLLNVGAGAGGGSGVGTGGAGVDIKGSLAPDIYPWAQGGGL